MDYLRNAFTSMVPLPSGRPQIANASGKNLFAMIDTDERRVENARRQIKDLYPGDFATKQNFRQVMKALDTFGFQKLEKNKKMAVEVGDDTGHEDPVYVTVVDVDKWGSAHITEETVPVPKNSSLILGKDKKIYMAKQNETWIDEEGFNHRMLA
ncbi:hypothetical protein L596_019563 [Steinernema carpocapsae]|uniref:Uncharacterized protein n=1 Tax=Steinernema carpocapsae TaxID=34508 RepID=A0A4U5MQY7_STECR|nr:hypothetical protein L596_019563 [Steinernema carpocapsae]